MTRFPEIFLSSPPTDEQMSHAVTAMLSQGHAAVGRDFWIRIQRPGGEPFEVSLLSLMEAAENMRRRERVRR